MQLNSLKMAIGKLHTALFKITKIPFHVGYMRLFTKLRAMKAIADIGTRAVMHVLKTILKLAKNLMLLVSF